VQALPKEETRIPLFLRAFSEVCLLDCPPIITGKWVWLPVAPTDVTYIAYLAYLNSSNGVWGFEPPMRNEKNKKNAYSTKTTYFKGKCRLGGVLIF